MELLYESLLVHYSQVMIKIFASGGSEMGLGKPNRTRLGEFLDERGISQEWLVNKSGVSRNTISRLANGKNEYNPSVVTMKKIIEVLREIDPDMKSSDIFDI